MLVYTVKNGDTLWQVAKEHQISLDALLAANPKIGDPNYILPGDMINVPRLYQMPADTIKEVEQPNVTDMGMQREPITEEEVQDDIPYCSMSGVRPCILVTNGGETLGSISEEWDIPLVQLHYHNYQYAKNSRLPGGERIIIPAVPDYSIDMQRYNRQYNTRNGRRR